MEKICHVTSAHPPEDGRIFRRACVSSSLAGYDTYLVEKGLSYDKNGIHIVGIGTPKKESRLYRMTFFARKAYKAAIGINADLYQLHDPELLPYALKLKKAGKAVVFDSHEDYVEQIKTKAYLPKKIAAALSKGFEWYSKRIYSKIDGVTYPGSGDTPLSFEGVCRNVVSTDNLPWLDELYNKYDERKQKEPNSCCYIGSLDEARGITQLVKAAGLANCKLYLAGSFSSNEYQKSLEEMKEFSHVEYCGMLNRDQIVELLQKIEVGLCTLLDVGQYYKMHNLPTKVYEYMSMGIPCVVNNSEFNIKFLRNAKIGIAVDSSDPNEISKAIRELLDDDKLREECGTTGRKLISDRYCWDKEQNKLIGLYQMLLQ